MTNKSYKCSSAGYSGNLMPLILNFTKVFVYHKVYFGLAFKNSI